MDVSIFLNVVDVATKINVSLITVQSKKSVDRPAFDRSIID